MQRLTDIGRQLCSRTVTLGAAMKQLNELPHPFVIVVDEKRRPIGTLTDGDIRRAVLAGRTLESPVSDVMNKRPHIGQLDEPAAARRMVEQLSFAPMVDSNGVLVEIWRVPDAKTRIGTALVMAGGFGRRLGKHTEHKPKPLLLVGSKPILQHILDWLDGNGIRNLFVSTHYLADQVEEFLAQHRGLVKAQIVHERETLGTAGALTCLPEPIEGPILVVNGDVLTKLDLDALDAFHHTHGYDGTVAVTPYNVSIPFGVVRKDAAGNFEGLTEKPTYTHFVAAGIYLLSPHFCRLVAPNSRIDMPDLLNLGREAGLKIGLFPIHEYWVDVGRVDDLNAANQDHRFTGQDGT